MRKIIVLLGSIFIFNLNYAQQTPIFSQYFINDLTYNPAVAGTKFYNPLVVTTRKQWLGFSGAPFTTNISYHTTINNRSAFGSIVCHDQIGEASQNSLELDYAYHIPLDYDYINLSFGIGVKSIYYTIDLEEATLPPGNDPAFNGTFFSQFLLDASSGLYLYGRNFYVGYSNQNMLESRFNKEAKTTTNFTTNKLERNHFGILGYRHEINPKLSVEPSILIRNTQSLGTQYDFSGRVFFYQDFWTAMTFRTNGSLSAIFGFIVNDLHLAYAYDHYFTAISAYQNGTHELSISWHILSESKERHISFWGY